MWGAAANAYAASHHPLPTVHEGVTVFRAMEDQGLSPLYQPQESVMRIGPVQSRRRGFLPVFSGSMRLACTSFKETGNISFKMRT